MAFTLGRNIGRSVGRSIGYNVAGAGETPASIAVGSLTAWYRASSLSLANGALVTTWNDESGKNNHLTQATASKQPVFVTGAINNRPAVRFDGTDDFMSNAAPSYSGATEFTIFTVAKSDDDDTLRTAVDIAGTGTDGLVLFASRVSITEGFGLFYGTGASNNVVTLDDVNTDNIWSAVAAATGNAHGRADIYLNGTQATNGSATAPAIATTGDALVIGSNSGTLRFLLGDLAEVIIYRAILSATQRRKVFEYIRDTYAISIT